MDPHLDRRQAFVEATQCIDVGEDVSQRELNSSEYLDYVHWAGWTMNERETSALVPLVLRFANRNKGQRTYNNLLGFCLSCCHC